MWGNPTEFIFRVILNFSLTAGCVFFCVSVNNFSNRNFVSLKQMTQYCSHWRQSIEIHYGEYKICLRPT